MTAEAQRAPRVRDRTVTPKAPRIPLGATSMQRAAHAVRGGARAVHVPSVPPINPDAEIHDALATVLARRAAGYAEDDVSENPPERDHDDAMIAAESTVWLRDAETAGGAAARLALLVPDLDNDRWVDRCLCEAGPLTLIGRKIELNDDARHVAAVMEMLICIEWRQALASYEASEHLLNEISVLRDAVMAESENFADPTVLDRLDAEVDRMQSAVAYPEAARDRLLCTLAPTPEAYRRKLEIALVEMVMPEALPWLDRDLAHLFGRLNSSPTLGA